MLTISCILWVANASLMCASSNKAWLLNAATTAMLTVAIHAMVVA